MGKYNPYAASAQRASSNQFNKAFHFDLMKEQQAFSYFSTKKDGDYEIALIPYAIASKKHPAVKEGAEVGDELYSFPYEAHRGIGPKKATVLCPLATFGKPCPICEAAEEKKRKNGYQDEEYKGLRPKRRVIYNVVDMNDPAKGIQIFEESEALFEQTLVKAAGAKGRRKGGDFVEFGDGKHSVMFTKGTKKIGTNDCPEYDSFDFEELDKAPKYPKEQKPFAFDAFMQVFSYEELSSMFYGEDDDDEDEDDGKEDKDEKPARKSKKEAEAEEDDEDEDDDEDDDEDEEDDKPKIKCPAGRKFGEGYDRNDDVCDDKCDNWKACRTATKELCEKA